jgi:hypothetical protein
LNIRISATRDLPDARVFVAFDQPHRRGAIDPLDTRHESPLGRLRLSGRLTEREYNAGCRWRNIYFNWLRSIGAPNPHPAAIDYGAVVNDQEPMSGAVNDDERDEAIAKAFKGGEQVLKKLGPRVFHAVGAVAVYEEPEELGDFQFTARAAKLGLAALAEHFGC